MIGGGRKNDVTDLKDNVFLHRDDDIGYMSDVLTYNSEALKILKKMKKKTDWIYRSEVHIWWSTKVIQKKLYDKLHK